MIEAKKLRIVFMGTPDFAVAPLRALVEGGYNVVAVVTSPDKPAGRGLKVGMSAVKQYAAEAGLPVLQPGKLRDPAFVEQFGALDADLGIVIAFRMLPEVIWAQPRLGTFNLHASLLPQYRGAAPINRAIMNGETETGVTTFFLNNEIDKGDILGMRTVAIAPDDDAASLHDKLRDKGVGLVLETVDRIAAGDVRTIPQPHDPAALKPAPKIFKDDCRIPWGAPAAAVNDFVRGLSPYPGAWSELATGGDTVQVKVFRCTPLSEIEGAPGTISTDGTSYFSVACGRGGVAIDELQLPGRRRMGVQEFLRGFKVAGECSFDE